MVKKVKKVKKVKMLKEDEVIVRRGEFARELVLAGSSDEEVAAGALERLKVLIPIIVAQTPEGVEYNEKALEKALEKRSLDQALLRGGHLQGGKIFLQLVALGAFDVIALLFDPKMPSFPKLFYKDSPTVQLQPLYIIYTFLLQAYDPISEEQSNVYNGLSRILTMIAGDPNTTTRQHFEKAWHNPTLSKALLSAMLSKFQEHMKLSPDENSERLLALWKYLYDQVPADLITASSVLKGFEPEPEQRGPSVDMPTEGYAIFGLYEAIVRAHMQSSPESSSELNGYQWLLQKVRGEEGSSQRIAFDASFIGPLSTAVTDMISKEFEQDFQKMLAKNGTIASRFWGDLLETIPNISPAYVLAKMYSRRDITVGSDDAIYASVDDETKTYASWPVYLYETQGPNWANIDAAHLARLVRGGAPLSILSMKNERIIIESLIDGTTDTENPQFYTSNLVLLIAALEGRKKEVSNICMMLKGRRYGSADDKRSLADDVFDAALETQNKSAIIALLQTDFAESFIKKSANLQLKTFPWILVALTENKELLQDAVSIFHKHKLLDDIYGSVVNDAYVPAVLALSKLADHLAGLDFQYKNTRYLPGREAGSKLQSWALDEADLNAMISAILAINDSAFDDFYQEIDDTEQELIRHSTMASASKLRERSASVAAQLRENTQPVERANATSSSNEFDDIDTDSSEEAELLYQNIPTATQNIIKSIATENWAVAMTSLLTEKRGLDLIVINTALNESDDYKYNKNNLKDTMDEAMAKARQNQKLHGSIKRAQSQLSEHQKLFDKAITEQPYYWGAFSQYQDVRFQRQETKNLQDGEFCLMTIYNATTLFFMMGTSLQQVDLSKNYQITLKLEDNTLREEEDLSIENTWESFLEHNKALLKKPAPHPDADPDKSPIYGDSSHTLMPLFKIPKAAENTAAENTGLVESSITTSC